MVIKVADFLTKNPVTDNVALIEIKKPSTRLLQSSEYRSGVYGPSAELSGSVAQVLDQRYHLTSEFAQRQRESRTFDIESFSIRTCLIIGLTPATVDQVKSFELFRGTLAGVDVVTFDELLRRVELLRSFLQPASD